MHNRYRGEIGARLDGRAYRLCLTLGALAELESTFGADDMVALASRFESGRLKAGDAIRVIGAGLRGGGTDITDAAVAEMRSDEGAGGYVAIVVRLLEATFGDGGGGGGDDASGRGGASSKAGASVIPEHGPHAQHAVEVGAPDPFPGTR